VAGFIKEIKQARIELGISHRQVSRDIGIGRSHLSEIEQGKFNISAKYGLLLCNYYGIDIQSFLDYKQEMLLLDIESIAKELNLPLVLPNVHSNNSKKCYK
jgi:transcriptional regulator with XRE-family HTH domain